LPGFRITRGPHTATTFVPKEKAMSQPTTSLATVLLVDDESSVRKLVHAVLTQQGYEVLVAASSAEAQDFSDKHPGPIRLLITDLTLPLMNGPTLAVQLTAVRPGLKVLFLSGYALEDAIQEGLLQPGQPFLHKPFSTNKEL